MHRREVIHGGLAASLLGPLAACDGGTGDTGASTTTGTTPDTRPEAPRIDQLAAGDVSLSRDETFDEDVPTVMLLAGHQAGEDYTLQALLDGEVVGETHFDVTLAWHDPEQGPPVAMSPAERVIRTVAVHNPYGEAAWFTITVDQDGDAFRTYLETTELLLAPGETREVAVMFEYTDDLDPRETRSESNVRITGQILDPRDWGEEPPADAPHVAGGSDFKVLNGWRTEFRDLEETRDGRSHGVAGQVVEVGTQDGVASGLVLITHRTLSGRSWTYDQETVGVERDGSFTAPLDADADEVRLMYLPAGSSKPYAPNETAWHRL